MEDLQSWVFAIRYLQSAMNCSAKPVFTKSQILNLFWAGTVIYTIIQLALYFMLVVSFTGQVEWCENEYNLLAELMGISWVVFQLISLLIATWSIYMIIVTIRKIEKTSRLSVDKW